VHFFLFYAPNPLSFLVVLLNTRFLFFDIRVCHSFLSASLQSVSNCPKSCQLTAGLKSRWDDWVAQDRLRKYSEENQELARNLKKEMDRVTQLSKPAKPQTSQKRKGGASGRGSEERNSTPALAGKKRGRDLETEKVRRASTLLIAHLPSSISSAPVQFYV
jgi:hypothetical protein